MKILAFAGSNSQQSINKKLVNFAAQQVPNAQITLLDLNDFDLPIYGIDREWSQGIPESALRFAAIVDQSDAIFISFAEHNGAYSVAFKNVFDWISRIPNRKTWGEKPMFLMSTSTGARGGATVLEIAKNRFPHNGGQVIASFSLPKFNENFVEGQGITHTELLAAFNEQIIKVIQHFERKS